MKAIIIEHSGDGNKMLSEAYMGQVMGGEIYKDPAENFIVVFSEELFKKISKTLGEKRVFNLASISKGWIHMDFIGQDKKLRRRIEEALRKTATKIQMLQCAKILGVKTE